MLANWIVIAAMLVQGVSIAPNQGGRITGTLRDVSGLPVAGIRVAAQARPDALKKLTAGASFAGLAETDSAGRFRLENVPPGQYYIVAGRIDVLTYYPGTVQVSDAKLIALAAGATISGIDFTLSGASVGRAKTSPEWIVPIRVSLEGGEVPVFSGEKGPMLRIIRQPRRPGNAPSPTIDGLFEVEVPVSAPSVFIQWNMSVASAQRFPDATVEYRVTVENLPEGYQVKSLTAGMVDLTKDSMPLGINPTVTTATMQPINVVLSIRR
jgi:hypothetical protein